MKDFFNWENLKVEIIYWCANLHIFCLVSFLDVKEISLVVCEGVEGKEGGTGEEDVEVQQ